MVTSIPYRRPMRFIGASVQAEVDKALIIYLRTGEQTLFAFGDKHFTEVTEAVRYSENIAYEIGIRERPWRITPKLVEDWSNSVTFKSGYRAAIHCDPDELVFQKQPPNTGLFFEAWDTGHGVVCGILAIDTADYVEQVCLQYQGDRRDLADPDVDRIQAVFDGQDVSELVRKSIRSHPNVKIWHPKVAV